MPTLCKLWFLLQVVLDARELIHMRSTKSIICAGFDQGLVDTFQGESGRPMVCETGRRYYLHGVTSWGYDCASPGKFGVNAKVTYVPNWLQSEMAKN